MSAEYYEGVLHGFYLGIALGLVMAFAIGMRHRVRRWVSE